ncbi:hypothetical protein ACFLQM_02655, partial [Acidobacteriota bacterium]
DLGRAYLEIGAYAEAHAEFENALKRKGEAAIAFLDEDPTYRYLPQVYYWLARSQEGLGSSAAADSYRAFLEIKANGEPEPMVTDSRKRLKPS